MQRLLYHGYVIKYDNLINVNVYIMNQFNSSKEKKQKKNCQPNKQQV